MEWFSTFYENKIKYYRIILTNIQDQYEKKIFLNLLNNTKENSTVIFKGLWGMIACSHISLKYNIKLNLTLRNIFTHDDVPL